MTRLWNQSLDVFNTTSNMNQRKILLYIWDNGNSRIKIMMVIESLISFRDYERIIWDYVSRHSIFMKPDLQKRLNLYDYHMTGFIRHYFEIFLDWSFTSAKLSHILARRSFEVLMWNYLSIFIPDNKKRVWLLSKFKTSINSILTNASYLNFKNSTEDVSSDF